MQSLATVKAIQKVLVFHIEFSVILLTQKLTTKCASDMKRMHCTLWKHEIFS